MKNGKQIERRKKRRIQFQRKPLGPNWEHRLLRANELATLLDLHPMTVWKWAKQGKLPAAIRMGPASVAWRGADIAAWIAERQESAA